MGRVRTSSVETRVIDSPVGSLTLRATENALVGLGFGDSADDAVGGDCSVGARAVLDEATRQLNEYFAGTRMEFDLPIDLDGTEFQVAAWRALLVAPFGTTMSYANQATHIGRPTATRAVGAANGRNPVAIILPCHRVVGSKGSLTGFAGGLDVKRWLLEHEQRVIASSTAGGLEP